jgi:hypothetical protein
VGYGNLLRVMGIRNLGLDKRMIPQSAFGAPIYLYIYREIFLTWDMGIALWDDSSHNLGGALYSVVQYGLWASGYVGYGMLDPWSRQKNHPARTASPSYIYIYIHHNVMAFGCNSIAQ